MNARYSALRSELLAAATHERTRTVEFLTLLAEFDALRLYVEDGYASMHAFCVGELRLCEEAAYKRIQAARVARRFPQLLPALAEGRLHLTAVSLLGPHLTPRNVDELIPAATHKTSRAIRDLITLRVTAPEPAFEWTGAPAAQADHPEQEPPAPVADSPSVQLDSNPVSTHVQVFATARVDRPRRIDVHCTVDREKLEQARALLSHSVPSGDLGEVIDRALDAIIRDVEKRRFGVTSRARDAAKTRPTMKARHIPARVKREVWKRDRARCTFVGRGGHRCGEHRFLEFDHVRPAALGGESAVENLRLRCRVHNQYEAERVYGREFMIERRAEARATKVVASDP